MSIELDRPGVGVVAYMFSFSTLLTLNESGMLADDELSDNVEQSLARLKAIDADTSVQSQPAWRYALDLLDQLHARFVHGGNRNSSTIPTIQLRPREVTPTS